MALDLNLEQKLDIARLSSQKTLTGVITKISIIRTQSLYLAKTLPEDQALAIQDNYNQMLTYINDLSVNINLIFYQKLEHHFFP